MHICMSVHTIKFNINDSHSCVCASYVHACHEWKEVSRSQSAHTIMEFSTLIFLVLFK